MFRYQRIKWAVISLVILLLLLQISSVISKPSSLFGFHTSTTTNVHSQHPQQHHHHQQQQQEECLSEEESFFVWEEEQDEPSSAHFLPDNPFPDDKPKRIGVWFGPLEDEFMVADATRAKVSQQQQRSISDKTSTHKLRMEQWNVTVRWRRKDKKNRPSQMRLEFHENGFVRYQPPPSVSSNSNAQPSAVIGTWRLAPSGVIWHMENYEFFADLHLNTFGKRPKMFRGIVVQDRMGNNNKKKRLLRPVAATFSGIGDGVDTADFSYKDRPTHHQ